jgi:ketosteroid isomerase-like protein
MGRESVESIRRVYERWAEGDFRSAVELFDPFVLFVMRPEFPDAGTYLGPDGVGEYMHGFLEPWEQVTIEAEEILDVGDSVVVAVSQRGIGAGSGAATQLDYFHVWSFRGGKAIRLESMRTRVEALEAVGLSE